MKIGFVVASRRALGPVLLVKTLAEELFERGYAVTVYYFDSAEGMEFKCPTKRISYFSSEPFRNNDIIHSHSLRPDIYNMVYGVVFRKPRISTAHCYVYEDFSMSYGKLISVVFGSFWIFVWSRLNMVVQLTDDMKDYYKSYLSAKKMTVIHNAKYVDNEDPILTETEVKRLADWRGKNFVVLGVSAKLIPRKGIDQLVNVLPLIPGFALFVLGDGEEGEKLKELAKRNNVEDRILWGGFRENAFRFLKCIDISVLPSYSEGFPLTLLEAIYFGKPIVCSDVAAHKSMFSEEEVAFFELGNIQSLAQSIQKCRESYEYFRSQMKVLAHKYSLNAMTESYLKLYSQQYTK